MNTLLEALSELKESANKRKIAANILCLGIDETNKDAYAYWENFEVDSSMDVNSIIRYIHGHCKMMYGNTIVYLITDVDTKETIYWEHQPSLYEETKSAVNEEADEEWKELTPEEALEFSRWTRWCFSPDLNGGRNTRYIYDYLDSGYTFYGKGKGTKKLLKAVNKKNGSTIGPYGWDGRLNPELIDEELNEENEAQSLPEETSDEWKELTLDEVREFSRGTKWCFNSEVYSSHDYLADYLNMGYTFYGKGEGENRLLKAVNKNGKELGPYDINDRKVSE